MRKLLLASLCLVTLDLFVPASLVAQDYDNRAREVVGKLTLDQKISQLHGIRDDERAIGNGLLEAPPVRAYSFRHGLTRNSYALAT